MALAVVPAVAGAQSTPPGPHSAGCGTAITAGETDQAIQFGSTARRYRLAVPADSGQHALPLILNFHRYGSNAIQQAIYSQLETKGPQRGFVVATPEGTATPEFWNILPQLADPDDVAYTGALIDLLEQVLCIDPTRVYSTGISNGAGLSALLGCRLPNRLAAIAPVAGINLVAGCPHGTPMSVLAFHGDADPVVAYAGGHTSNSLAGLPLTPVLTSIADWATRARCASKPTTTTMSPHITLTNYPRCAPGANVELYTIMGGGHTWPDSIDLSYLGGTTHEINAADQIMTFFSHHRRPGAK